MKKKIALLLIALVFIGGIPLLTKASEIREVSSIKSIGNIVYKSSTGSVELYAEDIVLLQEKLDTIPDEIFSPTIYGHMHSWEYIDITPKEHTKRCVECGSSYDVIEKHKGFIVSPCTISYGEEEYLGYKESCECGYEWEQEQFHNIVYESRNDSSHTKSCALSGTSYCSGMDSLGEEHSIMLFAMDELYHMDRCLKCDFKDLLKKEHSMIYNATDKSHHTRFCEECDFEDEEQECSFDEEDQEGIRKYCKCGNYITESSGGDGEPIPEAPDSDVTETGEFQEDNLTEKESEGGIL